ncbi:MAG: alkaline shock response membrane anchor protein AmaP [Candidatus Omnitrophota bacterium]|jgi:uncharacterized alkaline shock family protein YloU
MRVLGIIFYASILTLIGATLIIFAFNKLEPQEVSTVLISLQDNLSSRVMVGLSGLLLILITFSFAQLIIGRFQREKTIAFTTSSGEVSVALIAVEDLIKRLAGVIPEIKELRPDVRAKKDRIEVDLRVILRSEVNIPELTGRLQEITRSKIQEVLGLEEQIVVKIHIAKIISHEEKEKKKKEAGRPEPTVPFGSYGRTPAD